MTTPSWGRGDPRNGVPPWMWPVVIDARQREQREVAPATPIRIGDAERDEAVSTLGDHFAAGRLSREELDERIDQAMQAKFSTDLDPLFADLPKSESTLAGGQRRPGPPMRAGSPLFLIFPLLIAGLVITAIALGQPQLLFGLVWIGLLGRFFRQRWVGPRQHPGWNAEWPAHRPEPPAGYR